MSAKQPKLTDRKKRKRDGNLIQAASFVEVKDGIELATTRLRRHLKLPRETFQGAHVIEAFLAYCVTRSHEKQLEMAREGQAIVEELRLLDEPGPPLDYRGPASVAPKFRGTDDGGAGRKAAVPRGKPRSTDGTPERRAEGADVNP